MEKKYVEIDKHGVYRVVGHPRMMIDGIIHAFQEGDAPEAIITQWPFLSLEEIYGCITFYLANKQEVEDYLKRQDEEWRRLRAEQDKNPSPIITPAINKLTFAGGHVLGTPMACGSGQDRTPIGVPMSVPRFARLALMRMFAAGVIWREFGKP